MNQETDMNVSTTYEVASKKVTDELAAVKEGKDNRGRCVVMVARAMGAMLLSFCAQSDDFAAAVVERKGTLMECARACVDKHWTTGVSDKEAYEELAAYYMPGATVRASYRVVAPVETDTDLDFGDGLLPMGDDPFGGSGLDLGSGLELGEVE